MYDKSTSADIIERLNGYSGNNISSQINKLNPDLQNNFYKELEENLLYDNYNSDEVVYESLKESEKKIFKNVNYQIKRGIERDLFLLGKEKTLEKYSNRNYKTASAEMISDYIDYIEILDNIVYFFGMEE